MRWCGFPLLAASSLLFAGGLHADPQASNLDVNSREVKSRFDPRVRIIEYNPLSVVTIKQSLGYSIDIQFEADEVVVSIFAGDSLAWDLAPRGNHLGMKPREPEGRTNISIVTNKRVYQFLVDVVPKEELPDHEMVFFLVFNYPDNPGIRESEDKRKAEVQQMAAALKVKQPITNTNYVACRRDSEINPTYVWDDGRFTYMRFLTGQALPVVSTILPDGEEGMTNYRMGGQEGDGEADSRTMIIFSISEKFITRFGKSRSCIINKGSRLPPQDDVPDDSGSTRGGFMRIFRGKQ